MNKWDLLKLIKLMENDDKIVFLLDKVRYKTKVPRVDFDWISIIAGEFYLDLEKEDKHGN